MTDNGFLYILSDAKYAAALATSIHTLRVWHGEPITILATDQCYSLAVSMGEKVRSLPMIKSRARRPEFIAKGWAYLLSPHDQTIYLDADTLVMGDLSELFRHQFACTQVADYSINSNVRCSRAARRDIKYFESYGPIYGKLPAAALANDLPLINCGVVAYARDHRVLERVHAMCVAARHDPVSDQTALQLLVGMDDVTVVPDDWNWCVGYGDNGSANVWHFHRRLWAHKSYRDLWIPLFHQAVRDNACGMQSWVGKYNRYIGSLVTSDKRDESLI